MEGPTRAVLEELLNDLEALPDTDEHKSAAIAKVKAQIETLKEQGEA